MPGSFPDPRAYATTALEALEHAYEESYDSPAAALILTAMEAIKSLRQEIENVRFPGERSGYDPYEVNEANSAI